MVTTTISLRPRRPILRTTRQTFPKSPCLTTTRICPTSRFSIDDSPKPTAEPSSSVSVQKDGAEDEDEYGDDEFEDDDFED